MLTIALDYSKVRNLNRQLCMPKMRTPNLKEFFYWTVRRSFYDLNLQERKLIDYIVCLLAEFARTDNLYRIKNAQGQRLETIVEMLLEATNMSSMPYDSEALREREIRKHIGDYSLFMTGIFKEYVEKHAFFDLYLDEGRKAYLFVFDFDQEHYIPGSSLFFELSRRFEFYAGAINYMKKTFFKERDPHDPFTDFSHQLTQLP